jgi:nitrilase
MSDSSTRFGTGKPFKVAAAQLAPVFMKRDATIKKACDAIREAGKKGARIIVFPEAFVPTYPDWVWVVPGYRNGLHSTIYSEFLDQSVAIPSPATDKLCSVAKAAGVFVVMGVNERNTDASGGSVYNTLLYISDRGEIIGRHRKLVPTQAERLVWTPGDGATLEAYDTPYGKLGGLICWENYMPLARYAMYAWGVNIYVAATWDSSEGWLATLRHIAREGRCIVIGCCIAMRRDEIPDSYEFKSLYPEATDWINEGNSAIVSPEGVLAGPIAKEETIIYAEVDPARMRGSLYGMDVAGHYARPDVFQLTVNREPTPLLNASDNSHPTNGRAATPKPARRRAAKK